MVKKITTQKAFTFKIMIFIIFFGLLGYIGWLINEGKIVLGLKSEKISSKKFSKIIYVHIAGEIIKPGLYKIPVGSRLGELIDESGGLTKRADISGLNFANILDDGQKIIVPQKRNLINRLGLGKSPDEKYINPPIVIEKEE